MEWGLDSEPEGLLGVLVRVLSAPLPMPQLDAEQTEKLKKWIEGLELPSLPDFELPKKPDWLPDREIRD